MVGLDRAADDEGVGPLFESIGNQELELAGLVAAGCEPQEVVTLDEDVGPAYCLAQTGQEFERGFSLGVAPAWKDREVHVGSKLLLIVSEADNRLDFDVCVFRERGHLHGGARWQVGFEILAIDLVHGREIPHIR